MMIIWFPRSGEIRTRYIGRKSPIRLLQRL